MDTEVLLSAQSRIPTNALRLVSRPRRKSSSGSSRDESKERRDVNSQRVTRSEEQPLSDAESHSSSRADGVAFHRFFGRPGHLQPNKTTRHSWKQYEAFESTLEVPWIVPLSPGNLLKLLHGFSPVVMDDKWFIYSTGPDTQGIALVNFHRSWGGIKVAELRVEVSWGDNDAEELWTGRIVQLTMDSYEGELSEQDLAIEIEWVKYQVLMSCVRVLYVQLVDKIEIPAKWAHLRKAFKPRRQGRLPERRPQPSQDSSEDSPVHPSRGSPISLRSGSPATSSRAPSWASVVNSLQGSPRPLSRNSLQDSPQSNVCSSLEASLSEDREGSAQQSSEGSAQQSGESSARQSREISIQLSRESSEDGRYVYRAFTLSDETEEDIARLGGMETYLGNLPPGTTISFT